MYKRGGVKTLLVLTIGVLNMLLSACNTSPGTEEVVLDRQQVEHELVAFMLDYIVQQQIPENMPYIPPEDRSANGPPAVVSIIIQAPPGEDPDSSHNTLDLTQPIRVWLYTDNQLYEAIDRAETIAQYRRDYMDHNTSQHWGYYDFGIISISDDGQQAKVFWEVSCGMMCGHGYMNILDRTATGIWEITGAEWMWIA
jgi:hypothetical protein